MDLETAAVVLAALEVLPAGVSDLTQLLRDPDQSTALANLQPSPTTLPLTRYIIDSIDRGRVEHWHKSLDHDVEVGRLYTIVLAGRAGYPRRLEGIWDAPPLLFVRGTLVDNRPTLAIVGSRKTDEGTERATYALAAAVAGEGVEIVSGLALGVDAAAHRGALATGRTTAVLGTGLLRIFPEEHQLLAQRICTNGALISEFAPSAPRTRTGFLWRNGTIAALSDVLLVMDAGARSGSRHAVSRALEYGKHVLMWADTLSNAPWARELAASGRGQFINSNEETLSALREARP